MFVGLGVLGFALALLWLRWMFPPASHSRVTPDELDVMRDGGALVDLDRAAGDTSPRARSALSAATVREIFSSRALSGVYLMQYAVNALTYFLITWFPVYLIPFFGKGLGALGWAITTDIAPREASSFVGSTMNAFGNIAGIVTPIVIGYTVHTTGSFDVALWSVAAHGVVALAGLALMGTIRRIHLTTV